MIIRYLDSAVRWRSMLLATQEDWTDLHGDDGVLERWARLHRHDDPETDRLNIGVKVHGLGAVEVTIMLPDPEDLDDWFVSTALRLHWYEEPDCFLGTQEDCRFLQADCWNDVTFLGGDPAIPALELGGIEGVWAWIGEHWLPSLKERAA